MYTHQNSFVVNPPDGIKCPEKFPSQPASLSDHDHAVTSSISSKIYRYLNTYDKYSTDEEHKIIYTSSLMPLP